MKPVTRTRGAVGSGPILNEKNGNVIGWFQNAGAPTSGTSGTYAGQAAKGSILSDTTNGKLYINTNTLASPTWTVVGSQS